MQLWCLWRGRGVNNKGPESSGIIRTSHLAGARAAFWSLMHPSVESAEASWKFYYISNLEPSYCFSWPVIGPGGTKPLTFEVSPSALFKAQKESRGNAHWTRNFDSFSKVEHSGLCAWSQLCLIVAGWSSNDFYHCKKCCWIFVNENGQKSLPQVITSKC